MLHYQSCHQQIKHCNIKKKIGVHVLMFHADGRGMGERVCVLKGIQKSFILKNTAKGADKTLSLPYLTLLDTFALNY